MRDTPPKENISVSLKSASNEYEPFRIIIHNEDDKMVSGLSASVSDLSGAGGIIKSDNIALYRANYIYIDVPSPRTKNPAGWYPDALIPFKQDLSGNSNYKVLYVASPFSVDTAQNAEIWCDLYVPAGTKPGTYKGNVKVSLGRKVLAEIPVALDVWDFMIPEKISMPSHFGTMRHAARVLGLKDGSQEYLEMEDYFNRELLLNRAVPATPARVWPEWNETDGLIEKGEAAEMKKLVEEDHFNALDIPFRFKDEPSKCRKHLAATSGWLRKLGYLDIAYIYMEDEPNTPEQYDLVRKQGALIKSADPEIGRLCTEQTITSNPAWGDLYGAVTIWCPLWGLWDEKTANERLAKGEKLWSYTALCQCSEETPWWEIDMEPVNYRSPMWISWNYNITGFLYWSSIYWGNADSPEEVWVKPVYKNDGSEFWGEGTLVYPGKPSGIKGFIPSIRLKLYREAEEDYEYITMAAKSGKTEEVKDIVTKVASSFQNWSHDPEVYMLAREQLANLIVNSK